MKDRDKLICNLDEYYKQQYQSSGSIRNGGGIFFPNISSTTALTFLGGTINFIDSWL